MQLVLSLIQGEAAKKYLEENWQPIEATGSKHNVDASDLPFIVELANQELLPIHIRDEMYKILMDMVPKFGDIE